MKMKEVIAQTGIPERTIRFYEERGLIQVSTERRNGRTYHEFTAENVRELKQILLLRKARFSLEEIGVMQSTPEKIPQIVGENRTRLQQEKETLEQLTLDETLETADDWQVLSERIAQALGTVPDYELKLNFGRFNEETPEERQAAIEAFRNKPDGRFFTKGTVRGILALIFLAMVGINIYLVHDKLTQMRLVPSASGSTEGWAYYRSGTALMRSQPDGSEPELIYTQKNASNPMQFIVDEEKIYVLDGMELYSVNADGTNAYQYTPELANNFTNAGKNASVFLLYEGNLYVGQHQGATYGSGKCYLTRVPVDGSVQTALNIDILGINYEVGDIVDGVLYLFGSRIERYTDEGEIHVPVTFVYDLSADKLLQEYEGEEAESQRSFVGKGDDQWYFEEFFWNDPEGVAKGSTLIRVTPENLAGEALGQFPGGRVCDACGDYIILWMTSENQNEGDYFVLENFVTGESIRLDVEYGAWCFTEEGLMAISDDGSWMLIPYP